MPMARLSRESRMWLRESTLRSQTYVARGQGRISYDTTRMRYVMTVLLVCKGNSPGISLLSQHPAMAVEKLSAVCCLALLLVYLASPVSTSLIGYLSCLSRDLDIVGFGIDTAHTLTHAYRLQTDGGGDDLTPLRDPCPSCPPSYNLLSLQDYQLLIPVSGKLYIFTVVNNTPYSQIVVTAACNPISIFKPDRNYFDQDTLFVECRRQSNRNQYFLAKLVKDPNDLQWSYQTLINYDDLTSNGAFQYYIDEFGQYMVYYAYGRGDLLYFEGPDDGYYRFFALPIECAKVVRITRTVKHPQLVIECSSSSNSSVQTINSVFLFDPDFGEFDSLFQGTAYSKCPVRFSDDDSIIAIFTGDSLLVGELSSPSRRVTVENVSSVYDAVLTQVDGNFYAAFTNTSGLYTVNVSQALEGGTVVPLRANDSEDICAHTGCPLLEIIDANTTIVHLNRSIATFSIHPPRLLNSSPISNQPVRFIFYKLHPQATPTAQTATGTTTPSPPPLSLQTSQPIAQPTSTITLAPGETNLPNLIGPKLPIEEGSKFFGFLVIIGVIVALVTIVVCKMYSKYRGSRRLNGAGSEIPLYEPGSESPLQEPGLESPLQEPGLESPLQEPGSESPLHEPGSEIPLYEPGSEIPLYETGPEIPPEQSQPDNNPGSLVPGTDPTLVSNMRDSGDRDYRE